MERIDLSSLAAVVFNGNGNSDQVIFQCGSAGKLLLSGNLGARTQVNAQDATAQITFAGDTSFAAGSTLNVPAGTQLTAKGDLSMSQTVESAFGVDDAILRFDGVGGQQLEVGGTDSGVGGFTSSNFGIGQLVIGTPAQGAGVELVDIINNGNRGGSGGNAEALYLFGLGGPAGLVVHPESVLTSTVCTCTPGTRPPTAAQAGRCILTACLDQGRIASSTTEAATCNLRPICPTRGSSTAAATGAALRVGAPACRPTVLPTAPFSAAR